MSQTDYKFQVATTQDVPAIVELVDSVYRGDHSRKGWTTEADILGGRRTDDELIHQELAKPDSLFLLVKNGEKLLASVQLEKRKSFAYLGMLSVDVSVQNQKLGRKILTYAENFVQHEWQLHEMRISVIQLRHELMAWYERRGYRLTGKAIEFPKDPRFGLPKVEKLELLEMVKAL